MKQLFCAAVLCASLMAAEKNPFAGRWDIDIKTAQDMYPGWMEVAGETGDLKVRYQPRGGAVRPAVGAAIDGAHLIVTLAPATEKQPATTWNMTVAGDKLSGMLKRGDMQNGELSGVRAPVMKRAEPKAWGKEEVLFNGKDLTGWEPVDNPSNSHWVAKDGELVNETKGSNIKTTGKYQDFQLHIEFMCPEHCNSGIYLRGRYEVQVGTEGGTQPLHEMGAIYGYTAPSVEMPMGNGEWQTMDITLVGRTVTVVRNGKTIHDHVELAGITGGALDSHEAEPGPFYLQGDHTGGLRYRNIKIKQAKR